MEIKVGIGVAFGRALMIKVGYSGKSILINDIVYDNSDDNDLKQFFIYNYLLECYGANINAFMNGWYNENCK